MTQNGSNDFIVFEPFPGDNIVKFISQFFLICLVDIITKLVMIPKTNPKV